MTTQSHHAFLASLEDADRSVQETGNDVEEWRGSDAEWRGSNMQMSLMRNECVSLIDGVMTIALLCDDKHTYSHIL